MSFFLLGTSTTSIFNDGEITHFVEIKHLGIHPTNTVKCTLIEVKKENKTNEFYMNVATVVCGDSRCRIDTIQVFWDELGFFKRLEKPKGIELEKSEGKHFEKEDYQKLNTILSNRLSSLKFVYKNEVVGKETTEGVDGYTGATIILHNNDYVKGAVWTCYTLWHWTNGDVHSIIRNITGDNLDNEALTNLLTKDEIQSKTFALEQIIRRKKYTSQIVELIQQQAQFNDYQLNKLILFYFENASTDIYQNAMLRLLKTENPKQRQLFLNGMSATKHQLPPSYFEKISYQLFSWNDYPSINQFLNIIENKKIVSSIVNQQLIILLKHNDFIMTRRIYWFLENQKLTEKQQQNIQLFYQKHQDKL